MLSKEQIKDLLVYEFDSVYCYNCGADAESGICDDCHRKYMNWRLSESCAEEIAEKIYGEENEH